MHILVADSDPIQVQSLTRGLKGNGHSVISATNLADAATALDEALGRIQLLLTDQKAPHWDAFRLAARARAADPFLPVIIMTTFISEKLRGRIEHESGIVLIEKPFALERLLREVDRLTPFTRNCTDHNWADTPET